MRKAFNQNLALERPTHILNINAIATLRTFARTMLTSALSVSIFCAYTMFSLIATPIEPTPRATSNTISIHFTTSHLCLKNPHLLRKPYNTTITTMPIQPGMREYPSTIRCDCAVRYIISLVCGVCPTYKPISNAPFFYHSNISLFQNNICRFSLPHFITKENPIYSFQGIFFKNAFHQILRVASVVNLPVKIVRSSR